MKNKIKSILITNDDGFNAAGLKVLKEIAKIFTDNIFVVAPKFNRSAKSRSITLNQEVHFEKKYLEKNRKNADITKFFF